MLLVAALAACAPATLQTARTNGEGNFQFGAEPGIGAAAGGGSSFVWPAVNLSARYGVSDRVDLGLRLGSCIYEFQTKFLLTDPAATDATAIAIAPSTFVFAIGASSGGTSSSVFFWDTRIPVLFGIPVGDGSEFTVGPKLRPIVAGGGGSVSTGTVEASGSAVGLVLAVGGTVGFAAKVGDKFRIVPGIDFDIPVVGAAAATGTGATAGATIGGVLVAGGVGFLFGGPE